MELDKLNEGESATVIKINLSGAIRRRLLDLGLVEGTRVECVLKSRKGDPVAYRIRGALIALRNTDSKHIYIKKRGSK